MTFQVLGIRYAAQGIGFTEWVSLFTLCLAPVIVHILSGTPQPTFLSRTRPRWHDRIGHYNPISILWRYGAITDRRIRATAWGPADLAATNALFWTSTGWDGSDEMAARSLMFALRFPQTGHSPLFSADTAKTVVTTLQGLQTLAMFYGPIVDKTEKPPSFALGSLFSGVALWGLIRLLAARWLTDDFVYRTSNEAPRPSEDSLDLCGMSEEHGILATSSIRFRPTSYWLSRLFRIGLFIIVTALALVPSIYMAKISVVSFTNFLMALFGVLLGAIFLSIYTYYTFWRGCRSTILPCISSTWYKAFTILFYLFCIFMMVCSAIETTKTPCGVYKNWNDHNPCPGFVPIGANPESLYFGLAALGVNGTSEGGSKVTITNFTGSCIGSASGTFAG
ncbi:hypothetical protein GQ53DRAFT_664608 [Thozetella sp. PMI_491]|nr:hypothetical protein GQ53DRAFT_664608 [Thozetella sp. PMI_491]